MSGNISVWLQKSIIFHILKRGGFYPIYIKELMKINGYLVLCCYNKVESQAFDFTRKTGAKVTGDWDSGDYSDEYIECTPAGGFDIRTAARMFSKMMRESLQPLIIHLPHVSVEFEPGCTAKEIVEGYHYAMSKKKIGRLPSNANNDLRDSPSL